MIQLTHFSTQYKSSDDRICITGEDNHGDSIAFWLTQRLLLRVIPVLIDWLKKNKPTDLKAHSNAEQAQEFVKIFTQKTVRQPDAGSKPATDEETIESPAKDTHAPVLVHSIDVKVTSRVLHIRFKHSGKEFACLIMNASQLRQWLAALQVLWRNAGWPHQVWPHWLDHDVKLISNESRGHFH